MLKFYKIFKPLMINSFNFSCLTLGNFLINSVSLVDNDCGNDLQLSASTSNLSFMLACRRKVLYEFPPLLCQNRPG